MDIDRVGRGRFPRSVVSIGSADAIALPQL